MANGYDQFFKSAKQAARNSDSKVSSQKLNSAASQEIKKSNEKVSNSAHKNKKKIKKVQISWKLAGISFLGLIISICLLMFEDDFEKYSNMIEIRFFGKAIAKEAPQGNEEKKSPLKPESEESKKNINEGEKTTIQNGKNSIENSSDKIKEDEIDHLGRLLERKEELDSRAELLSKQESDIIKQREELEKRIEELDKMRKNISSILEEKVKVDDERVENLMQTISGMKPAQAARMIEEMDEGLAVEIIGKMKKKNASEIMNLVKVEKGRSLIEKYAGYKKK